MDGQALRRGIDKAAQKLGEEAVETVIAAVKGDAEGLVSESADLLYHWLVVLAIAGVPLIDVLAELQRRTWQSGIAEKASRRQRIGRKRSRQGPMDQLVPTDRYSPYRFFTAEHWAEFRADTPLTLTAEEVRRLSSLYDPIDLDEVRRIYLSLSRLLSAHVEASQLLFSQRAGLLQRAGRGEDAVHHRHGRLRRRRQVDHCPHPEGTAGALAVEPEGRPHHH